MTELVFARERFSDELLAEMLPLLERHWREVAHYQDIPLEVDAGVYHAAEQSWTLRIFTARRDTRLRPAPIGMPGSSPVRSVLVEKELVGYAVFFVRPNPHYASSVQAVQDVLYVSPESRGSTGARLILFAHEWLASEGVQAVYQHVKLARNFGPMLERLGYEAVETIYAKRLDREHAEKQRRRAALDEAWIGEEGG